MKVHSSLETMELRRFQPYTFTTIAEIFDKHIEDVHRELIRYEFSEQEYTNKNLPHDWKSFKPFLKHMIMDLFVLIGLLLSYFNVTAFASPYNAILTKSFCIK